LHQLFVTVDGQEEPLLWSPEDPSEYGERPTRGGSFPMAPWPNRIRDGRFTWEGQGYGVPTDGKPHASHGRVFQRPWEVVGSDSGSAELRCALDDGWPWEGWAEQRFALANGKLRMELSVHTAGDRFPAGAGWHPWFRRDVAGSARVRVRLDAPERYVLVENLPTGKVVPVEGEFDLRKGRVLGDLRLDDCYRGLQRPIEMEWDRVRLLMEVSSETPHVQVFTPEYAVAVEPQTCVADAFNLKERGVGNVGVQVAEPGRPVRVASTWRWEA
jgi:galactose mutarotase-like enzyme